MARWKLLNPHYLMVEGDQGETQWEYKELDRNTGRQIRKTFIVPRYLDPGDPSDWTHKQNNDEGDIIVAWKGSEQPRDLILKGDPTPDMLGLDDEAKAISANLAKTVWKHPIDALPGTYSQSMLDDLQRQVAEAQSHQSVSIPGMEEFMGTMASVMKKQNEIMEKLASRRL